MYFNRLKIFNWKYIIGEIVLIFAGIQLSILYSNWSDEKKERKQEILFLKEIKMNIEIDTVDLTGLISFMKLVNDSDSVLLYNFDHKAEPDSSVSKALGYCFLYGQFFENRSAYETLKSHSLGMMSNDSLRSSISFYYESLTFLVKFNDQHYYAAQGEGYKIMSNYIKDYQPSVGGQPTDYANMRKDIKLKFYLTSMIGLNNITTGNVRFVNLYVRKLLIDISNEIDRLEN